MKKNKEKTEILVQWANLPLKMLLESHIKLFRSNFQKLFSLNIKDKAEIKGRGMLSYLIYFGPY